MITEKKAGITNKLKFCRTLRDGVTGNTSGFELEDEGSTPSPQPILSKRNKVLRLIYMGSNFYLKMKLA